MHVPDGFLDAPTSAATGAIAVVCIGVALAGARHELDDKTAPMAGLVAAFIFAVQMLNFPVASGTSGHLMGGALAAVLVGPWTAVLCMSVVFLVQCLLFADGGITALGTNITLMGLTTVAVGWLVFKLLQRCCPSGCRWCRVRRGRRARLGARRRPFFVGLYAVGGAADIPLGNLATAMVGVHVLIGIGEAVITFAAVASILAVRPDLVYGARPVLERASSRSSRRPSHEARGSLLGLLGVALVLAGVVSRFADSSPDGLTKVSQDHGFAGTEQPTAPPFAGYGSVTGIVGVLVVLALGAGLAYVVRRRGSD